MYTPKSLQWNEALSTGDESLDNQHKYLVDILNRLGEAIQEGSGGENINRYLGILRFYASWHFGKEEECMSAYRCPIAEKNKRAHTEFMENFGKFHDEYNRTGGTTELALKIHEELTSWIINHILKVDGQLYPCIHNKPNPHAWKD